MYAYCKNCIRNECTKNIFYNPTKNMNQDVAKESTEVNESVCED